jgi:hypothetical protein
VGELSGFLIPVQIENGLSAFDHLLEWKAKERAFPGEKKRETVLVDLGRADQISQTVRRKVDPQDSGVDLPA